MASDTQGKVSLMIGGAAVFVSLLYLAIETRVNTRAIQSAAYHDATMSFAEMNLTIARDPELSEIFRVSLASEDAGVFSEQEFFRFSMLATQTFLRYQDFYEQSRHGSVEDDMWVRRRNAGRALVRLPVWRRWWQAASAGDLFPQSFVEAINSAPDHENLLLKSMAGDQ